MKTQMKSDIVIIGGTPGGIAAAIAAARLGRSVTLVESQTHLGGMSTSGLGKSDVEKKHLIGGLFREFTGRVRNHYFETYGPDSDDFRLCLSGYYFEPSVAEQVFTEMLSEHPQVSIHLQRTLTRAVTIGSKVTEVTIRNDRTSAEHQLKADVFIDATYEGDLMAMAGAGFRFGRESRDEYDEPHAGVVYFDYQNHQFLPGSTGEGDERLPAYTYRLCLATDPDNSVPLSQKPASYDRRHYAGYLDDLATGRLGGPKVLKPGRGYEPAHFNTTVRALSVTPLPNGKTDVNINPRPLGFPFPEENRDYVPGDERTRCQTRERIRELTLGLLWFLQNDSAIDSNHRAIARHYQLPMDEFSDNGHFPFQLYIREARRLIGEFTLTEHHITRPSDVVPRDHSSQYPDTIAIGEFPIDSFPCRKRQPDDRVVLEGYLGMLDHITRPYEIPYRIMVPASVDGLIVPVSASTTHVAFSSIRMEPTWMALGQAAGVAAHLSIQHGVEPRSIPSPQLRNILRDQGQILKHSTDDVSTTGVTPCH